jgi:magnesium-transporting ATPase (P-type)
MIPQDHNKLLGILHLAYGGLNTLVALIVVVVFGLASVFSREPVLFLVMMLVSLIVYTLLILPSLIAGYGLLKQKRWAKLFAMISAVLAAINFPHGTALCVYTFWFLTGDMDKAVYEGKGGRASLQDAPPPPPPFWTERNRASQEREYVPPHQPPDWR